MPDKIPCYFVEKKNGLVDVAEFAPATPCLQSKEGEILNAFAGVAYTENQPNSRSSIILKLSRISELGSKC